MADLKISELTAASSLTGAELVEVVQGGVNKQTTTQNIADLGGGVFPEADADTKGIMYLYDSRGANTEGTMTQASITGELDDIDDQLALKAPLSGSKVIQVACSDQITALTSGTGKVSFRMPFAMILTAVRASLSIAQTSGSIFTVDINESGSTILSTKLTIDNTEKTSTTAATPPVISDSSLSDDAEITVDIDQVGDGTAKGLIVTLIGS